MNPAIILKLVLLLGVVLLVVAIGTRARLEEPLLMLRRPALALRAMLAMYGALPAFVLLLVWLLPLREGVGAVLLGFAVSPVLPPWAKKGAAVGGNTDYVIGLQLLSTGIALLVVPLMIAITYRLFGVVTAFDPLAMELVLLVTVAIPLPPGIGLARLYPSVAPGIGALADRLGRLLILIGAVALLVSHGQEILEAMGGVIGQGTVVVTVVVIAFGLLVGELLGGPDPGNRRALASATVCRHPAIALLLASGAFPEREATVIGTVLLYLLASLVLPIPYERWRK